MKLARLGLWEDDSLRPAAENMAWDEALATIAGQPVLRTYRWDHPAATFGYFCRHRELAAHLGDTDATRRLTGGGLVEHGSDLTLTMALPRAGGWRRITSSDLYCLLHRALADSLAARGQPCELQPGGGQSRAGGACFASPVAADLMLAGRKVGGGAIRRTRDFILYQGSLREPAASALDATHLASLLCGTNARVARFTPSADCTARAGKLALERYSRDAWIQSR